MIRLAIAALFAFVLAGCGPTTGGSAIATGPYRLPPSAGPVALYATTTPQGREIGEVEAHAWGEDGTVETLVPILAQKTAQIGGNAVKIESVRADFRIVNRPQVETYYYPCGFRSTCASTRVYPASEEMMVVTMRGRAYRTEAAPK